MPEREGLVLGKFLPPHRGHQYLIDFARAYADHVTVHVCPGPDDPIPGPLRFRWMREQFSGCANVTVIYNDDPNPQTPAESPSAAEFYQIWRESLLQHSPRGAPDYVFASEPYGFPLAECLDATYIPVDQSRASVPISGTRLREDVLANWPYLLPPARPHFARRVAIVGPESSGKSTLTARLAAHFNAPFAAEYARSYLEATPESWIAADGANGFGESDVETILRGQRAAVEAMARRCEALGLVFSDTEAIVTACWSQLLLGHVPAIADEFVERQHFDLYLLSTAAEFWVNDESQRVQPDFADRLAFERECRQRLEATGRGYVELSGDWEARFAAAVEAVDGLLRSLPLPASPPLHKVVKVLVPR